MKSTEELTNELENVTKEALLKAKEFDEALRNFDKIELGEHTEEDKENIKGFYGAVAARQQAIIKRLLVDWGGILFL